MHGGAKGERRAQGQSECAQDRLAHQRNARVSAGAFQARQGGERNATGDQLTPIGCFAEYAAAIDCACGAARPVT